MVARNNSTKKLANMRASKARDKGFSASVFKKKKGYGVSITRKK